MIKAIILWYFLISLALFAAMGIDKAKAKTGARRIPEKTLFLMALIGGAPGGILGMYIFRHKTRHPSFRLGMPALLLLNMVLLALALRAQ